MKEIEKGYGLEIEINKLNEAFELFLPTNKLWKGYHPNTWIFRGHSLEKWLLIPKIFRNTTRETFKLSLDYKTEDLQLEVSEEFSLLHDFLTFGDKAGLSIPIEGYNYIRYPKDRKYYNDKDEKIYKEFPDRNLYNLMALAQHHGIPTRFLDFTFDPYTALFFAADYIVDEINKFFVVYAINNFNQKNIIDRYEDILSPNFYNDYLKQQKGLFLLDKKTNDVLINKNEVEDIEKVFCEEFTIWKKNNPNYKNSYNNLYHFMIKIKIIEELRRPILLNLNKMGYNRSSIMPSYDNVTATIIQQKYLGII